MAGWHAIRVVRGTVRARGAPQCGIPAHSTRNIWDLVTSDAATVGAEDDADFALGRADDPFDKGVNQLPPLMRHKDVPYCVKLSEGRLQVIVTDLGSLCRGDLLVQLTESACDRWRLFLGLADAA